MPLTSKTVLIVEDDKSILDATQMALELEGYTVMTGTRGTYIEQLVTGSKQLPDCILLDLLLSGSDGREMCRLLKASNLTKHIPVIIMSAHPSIDGSAKEAGADLFLPKPFSIDELLSAVKKFV